MTKPTLPSSSRSQRSRKTSSRASSGRLNRRASVKKESSDVLISAVISTYLLTHLHHVLQRAEYGALKEGRSAQATNFAQLRKVLCMDARSMKDASALGNYDEGLDKFHHSRMHSKVA